MSDKPLTPELPKKYKTIPRGPGERVPRLAGAEIERILAKAEKQGYLVVPYRKTEVSGLLSNSWYVICEKKKIPFIRAHVKPDGYGHAFFDLWFLGFDGDDSRLLKRLDVILDAITDEEQKKIGKAMPRGGLYSIGNSAGWVGFSPRIAREILDNLVQGLRVLDQERIPKEPSR